MTAVIALPRLSRAPAQLDRYLGMLWREFSAAGPVILLADEEDRDAYAARAQALGMAFEWATTPPPDPAPHHFIAVKDSSEALPEFTAPPGTQRIYSLGKNARLHCTNDWLNEAVDPFLNYHVFNRCTPPTAEPLFSFAPYTYFFRYPGMGKYNAFGHRIAGDVQALADRDGNHKVVAVFGGSACWSIFCYDHEVFTRRLEERLNADARGRFTVLNFGLPGNIVLNETITYLLHCHRLRPDIVIAHDGFNDLFYGMTSDPHLVRNHAVAYQFNLEEWAHTMQKDWYARASQPFDNERRDHLTQPEWPLVVRNLPQDVLLAYCQRKAQFKHMVEGLGGRFVWGVQPYLLSKNARSQEEQTYFADLAHDNTVRDVYRRIPFLYEKLKLLQGKYAGDALVDFDSIFAGFPASETLFADYCHLTPAGDGILAEHYYRHIVDHIFPTMESWK